jgi:hypothetical protein
VSGKNEDGGNGKWPAINSSGFARPDVFFFEVERASFSRWEDREFGVGRRGNPESKI